MELELATAPKGGLTAFVEKTIKDALMSGGVKPGEHLVTRTLAQKLGTSPTPVREALLRLAASGALEISHGYAFRVPKLSARRVHELAAIRNTVEGWAAEIAAEKATGAQIDALERLYGELKKHRMAGDLAGALAKNRAFRFAVYAICDMPILYRMIETFWLQAGPMISALYPQRIVKQVEVPAYEELIAALREHDGHRARLALQKSIEKTSQYAD